MPSLAGQPVRVDQASDEEFQAWVETNKLTDIIDDNGITAWSFDDRMRVINGAIRLGRELHFAGETIPRTITERAIVSQLFEELPPA